MKSILKIKSNQTFRDVLLPHDNFRNDFPNSPPPPYLIQNMELNIKEGVSFKILLNKQITIVNIFQPTNF